MTPRHRAEGAQSFRPLGWIERLGARGRARLGPAMRARLKPLYHAALRLRTRGRGVPCRLPGGEVVRALPERGGLIWNPDEYAAFRAAIRPGAVALDIGANAGAYALLFGQWVGAAGRVYAFEPSPAILATLRRHIAINRLDTVVTPVGAAVCDRVGRATFVLAGTSGENHLGMAGGVGAATVDVETTTVDAFCRREGVTPDFIKIDVEGAELDVLRGARETISAGGTRLALFVEMHPAMWPAAGLTPDAVRRGIHELGLEPERPWADILGLDGLAVRLRARV